MTATAPGTTRHPGSEVVVTRLDGFVPYLDGWSLQREQHALVAAGGPGRLLLLQHNAVYTAGRRTSPSDRPSDGTPVVDVDRGGRITWHGPGQLVGYPLVRLPDPIDVVAYVRALEGALIRVCEQLGLATERVEGRSGVWVVGDGSDGPTGLDRKVAAIGIRVARGVTMHGFSLNCDCDLSWAAPIVPCGIPDAGVTSLSVELGRAVTVEDVLDLVEREVLAVLPR